MRARITIVTAVLAAALLLAGTASAHIYPSKRSPSKGATVSNVKRVSMKFDGQLRSGSIKVKRKKSGKVVSRGGMVNAVKVATKKKRLGRGKYVAVVKITSADGHVQKFKWSFKVR